MYIIAERAKRLMDMASKIMETKGNGIGNWTK
jgi:hypothetical protein